MIFVVNAKNDTKKTVIMLMVIKKMRFLKIYFLITFFNMGD